MNKSYIQLMNISKYIDSQCILDDINLSFEKGKTHVLWGANGAGKSMLIKILCGVTSFDSGSLVFDGKVYTRSAPALSMNPMIALSPQNNCIIGELTVFQNLFMNTSLWFQKAEDYFDAHIPSYLTEFSRILRPLLYVKARDLSPSILHLLQLARTVLSGKDVLIFDEPLVFLPDHKRKMFQKLVKCLQAQGKTLIIISHLANHFTDLAHYITILKEGKIVSTEPQNAGISSDLVQKFTNSLQIQSYPKLPVSRGDELLSVEYLSDAFIRNISFNLHGGEVLGITGSVSSGKSQIARLLMGSANKYSGKICYEGNRIHINSPSDAIEQKIYYLPQDRDRNGLFLTHDIRFNIVEVNTLKMGVSSENTINTLSNYYRNRLKINARDCFQKVSCLSNGNRQKVMISRAFCNNPKIFILDEPTAEVDSAGKSEIYNIMNHLLLNGAGVILISSDFTEISALCDKVLFMHKGECVKNFQSPSISPESLYNLCAQYSVY